MKEKECSYCKVIKPVSDFHKRKISPDGLQYECKVCAERHRSPERERARKLKYCYRLTPAEFNEILKSQGGVCKMCGKEPGKRKLCVDHDHSCCPGEKTCGKCFRGLVCYRCNTMLGYIESDLYPAALEYIKNGTINT